jgi:YHS domain-containing protein
MHMGGDYTRTIQGKEYQFCSVQCSNHYHPPMKDP